MSKSRVETNAKKRFSDRVAYYAKYRPRYPDAILDFMEEQMNLSPMSVIADIGSGTGILSEIFLRNGNLLFGVEPNKEMRDAAESSLAAYTNFRSINGSAESTALPACSVDFVTAAQSFHWFDRTKAKKEFLRILRPSGWVLLAWNTRRRSTPFLQAYEKLVHDYAGDHDRVRHEDLDENAFANFFAGHKAKTFDNVQLLDYQGLVGRLLSSSYTPLHGDPRHDPMVAELRRIFDSFQSDGLVRLEYDTEVHYGRLRR